MENTNKNLFETMTDMQKQAAEQIANATEKMKKTFSNGSPVNFDSDVFSKWYDSQMAWFNNAGGQNKDGNKALEFFNTWMSEQMNAAKAWFEKAQGGMPNMFGSMPGMFGSMPGFGMNSNMNDSYSNMMNLYKNWMDSMNSSYSEMQKTFSNGNAKEAFSGMFNNADMYMKAFQFWMPVMKTLQDKTFTTESFKQMFNTGLYKEMMDKMFNMQPDFMKSMFEKSMNDMKGNFGKTMDMNQNAFESMKQQMMNNMPDSNVMFGNMMESYNKWYSMVSEATAPLTRLMPQNATTKQAESIREMMNEMMVYNMKNNQMKYIMYNTGLKAMEETAEALYSKVRSGEEVSDFTSVYTNWLNTNDSHFVKLFESEEYSKLMSEVSAMQLTLKKKFEKQVESAFSTLPIINRSEMDELYKTVQVMKTRINTLEKQLDKKEVVVAEEKKESKSSHGKRSSK